MGIDISGAVECHLPADRMRPKSHWTHALDLVLAVPGRPRSFGALFGVRYDAGFAALPPARGLPYDVAKKTRRRFDATDGAFAATWIGWQEIEAGVDAEQRRRPETVAPSWRPLFTIMAALATVHGPDAVRLVVWFNR